MTIQPVMRSQIRKFFQRQRGPLDSTDFSISRFLVPHLMGYKGLAVFMDCDMLCQADVAELVTLADSYPNASVLVAQHSYTPKNNPTKLEGAVQTTYHRKNWSSLMVMRTDRCKALTRDYVERAHGLDLHGFVWMPDSEIAPLPLNWNWLVGEYAKYDEKGDSRLPKMLHYTLGGPWLPSHHGVDHADLWLAERAHMMGE